ncbi:hypothetical protein [Acinetobacter guillouiae]|uniref:hypothetical protein n=1 Tax=Acinetobacter guillouiae TaxID=106649 RepID=UPI0026E468B8|nr:hypothetical protein [Acinetobacter guillouiae]MDO6646527.1 hypothetical protein [Acinetobacter guillouiae]
MQPTTSSTDFQDIFDILFKTNQFESSDVSKAVINVLELEGNCLKEIEKYCLKQGYYFKIDEIEENLLEIGVSQKPL